MSEPKDDWRKDMGRCELNDYGPCLANIPKACICAELRRLKMFLDAADKTFNEAKS